MPLIPTQLLNYHIPGVPGMGLARQGGLSTGGLTGDWRGKQSHPEQDGSASDILGSLSVFTQTAAPLTQRRTPGPPSPLPWALPLQSIPHANPRLPRTQVQSCPP